MAQVRTIRSPAPLTLRRPLAGALAPYGDPLSRDPDAVGSTSHARSASGSGRGRRPSAHDRDAQGFLTQRRLDALDIGGLARRPSGVGTGR
jgi:hypothetical protein